MVLARFVDPQRDTTRPHVVVPATSSRPLPRRTTGHLTGTVHGAGRAWPLEEWRDATGTTALLALVDGAVVHEWYAADSPDGPVGEASLLLGASMTKSALAHLVGLAVGAGALRLDDAVTDHVPELRDSGWRDCRVLDVLTMTSGADWVEDHRDPHGPAARLVASFAGGDSRALLRSVGPRTRPGTVWEYSTADSQVLDWVRERATGAAYDEALGGLWGALGCVHGAVVAVDAEGVALAGGGLAACAEDWLRLVALQLDGTATDGTPVLPDGWVAAASAPAYDWTAPGRLPSTITTHAGFGRHWWPTTPDGRCVVADGSRGQLGHVDRDLGVAVLKTSLWPYDDPWVDRQQRDLSYLGLPVVSTAAARHHRRETP